VQRYQTSVVVLLQLLHRFLPLEVFHHSVETFDGREALGPRSEVELEPSSSSLR
jgi:hypothetical protein